MSTDSPPAWLEPFEDLERLTRASELLALLRAARASGLLDDLAAPVAPAQLAAGRGVPTGRVEAVLDVLRAWGVAAEESAGWRLTPGWRQLVAGESPVSFDGVLGLSRVSAAQFADALGAGETYGGLDDRDRHLVALGISPDPRSPAAVEMAAAVVRSMPEADHALSNGGRLLELGCGLASRLCAVLQAYPTARGVGVELAPGLAAAARERAAGLGLEDRLEVVAADASTYEPDGPFDLVQWSQFFFGEEHRAGALATAHRALRPGGWLNAPAISDGDRPAPGSHDDRELVGMRLQLDLWGVPFRDAPALAAEIAAAGFVDVVTAPPPPAPMARGRRP